LDSFDFKALPALSKLLVLELARSEFIILGDLPGDGKKDQLLWPAVLGHLALATDDPIEREWAIKVGRAVLEAGAVVASTS
ncbi:MAG: hypothetical protein V3V97_17925, partial [Hyphomicrobiaceae bacterium]